MAHGTHEQNYRPMVETKDNCSCNAVCANSIGDTPIAKTKSPTQLGLARSGDDLDNIKQGIERMSELFERRCEDHAELIRYCDHLLQVCMESEIHGQRTQQELARLLDIQHTVADHKARWKGL